MKIPYLYTNLNPDKIFIRHELVDYTKQFVVRAENGRGAFAQSAVHNDIYFIQRMKDGTQRWYKNSYIKLSELWGDFDMSILLKEGRLILETISGAAFTVDVTEENNAYYFDIRI